MHVMRYRAETKAKLVADVYDSGDSSERTSLLNASTGDPAVVYSVPLSKVAAGQLIEALGELEVDSSYLRAGIHTSFVLADSPLATSGISLEPDHFTELNPYMGSLPINDSASLLVPSGISGTKYLNLVASAQLLQVLGTAPDNNIAIAPDDGRLVVQRFRPPV
jgi:hypothetical protein